MGQGGLKFVINECFPDFTGNLYITQFDDVKPPPHPGIMLNVNFQLI